jgi:hypothetical protein
MSGSERRKAPQLSATDKSEGRPAHKGDRKEVHVYMSRNLYEQASKHSEKLFGEPDVLAFTRLAISEKIQGLNKLYEVLPLLNQLVTSGGQRNV